MNSPNKLVNNKASIKLFFTIIVLLTLSIFMYYRSRIGEPITFSWIPTDNPIEFILSIIITTILFIIIFMKSLLPIVKEHSQNVMLK